MSIEGKTPGEPPRSHEDPLGALGDVPGRRMAVAGLLGPLVRESPCCLVLGFIVGYWAGGGLPL